MRLHTILFIACLYFIPVPAAHAAEQLVLKIMPELSRIEALTREKHGVAEVLKRTSELRSFAAWPKDLDPNLKLIVARQWIEQRHAEEAFQLLKTMSSDAVDPNLWRYALGTAALETGRADEFAALVYELDKTVLADPDYIFLKSVYLAQKNDLINATKFLNLLIDQFPRNGAYLLQRGIIYVYSLSHELAFKDFRKAIKTLPESDRYRRQMAYLQAGLIQLRYYHNDKKAAPLFKIGIAIDPDSELVKKLATGIAEVMEEG